MAQYGVEYLTRLHEAVRAFEEAFSAWAETQVEADVMSTRGLFPTVWLREGQDEAHARQLELKVAEAAGPASTAVQVTGCYMNVQGIGPIDPITNWHTIQQPRAFLTVKDVRVIAATVRGRLDALIEEAEAEGSSDLPAFSPARLHPVVWGGAAIHWTTRQYRVAVREAAEALTNHWKERLGRSDVNDTPFWQQTLSLGEAKVGAPKLRWPGEEGDKTSKSMRSGLEPLARGLAGLAVGLNLTVRNITTHSQGELEEQEAMERLAAYSFLARLLDQCEIVEVDHSQAEASPK